MSGAPQTAQQFLQALQVLEGWLASFPTAMKQRAASHDTYTRRHILRKFAMCMARKAPPGSLADLKLSELQVALPDQGEHLSVLGTSMRFEDVERAFGMCPFMVACWACLLSAVPPSSGKHFEKPRMAMLLKAEELMEENDGIAPALKDVAKHFN